MTKAALLLFPNFFWIALIIVYLHTKFQVSDFSRSTDTEGVPKYLWNDWSSSFACGLTVRDTKPKNEKWSKGGWPRSRDLLFELWEPPISLEWLKLQTSNFACRFRVRDRAYYTKEWKTGKKGPWSKTLWPTFRILRTRLISLERMNLQTSIFACGLKVRNTKLKEKNCSKGSVAKVTWPTFYRAACNADAV